METIKIKQSDIQSYIRDLVKNQDYIPDNKKYGLIFEVEYSLQKYQEKYNDILVIETESAIWGPTWRILYKDRK